MNNQNTNDNHPLNNRGELQNMQNQPQFENLPQSAPQIPENGQQIQYQYMYQPPAAPAEKTVYTVKETVFALLALIFGYVFTKSVFFASLGLGALIAVIVFVAFVLVYKAITHQKNTSRSIIYAVIILIFGSVLFISDNETIKFIALLFDMTLGMYWMFFTFENSDKKSVDYMIWYDSLKAIFVLPFSYLFRWFPAVFSTFKRKSGSKKVLYVIIGIAATIIPSYAVIGLLMQDAAFGSMINKIFSFSFPHISENIIIFVFSIPAALYLFGGLFGMSRRMKPQKLSREICQKDAAACKIVPVLTVCAAIVPLLIIYVAFFFSQTAYFISAFSNILPTGYSYAEYARSGFFELCRVAVINLTVLAAAEIFTKRNGKNIIVKILSTVLSVFTLMLIAIGVSKMYMYINEFGLSLLRYYTTWFMLTLSLILILAVLKQWLPKLNFTRYMFIVFTAMLLLLCFSNPDGTIANYNFEKYKNGEIKTLDVEYMTYSLSDSAVKYIIEAASELPEGSENRTIAQEYIKNRAQLLTQTETPLDSYNNFWSVNLEKLRAERLILNYSGFDKAREIFIQNMSA